MLAGRHAAAVAQPLPPEAGVGGRGPGVRLGAVDRHLQGEISEELGTISPLHLSAGHAAEGEESPVTHGQLRPEHPVLGLSQHRPPAAAALLSTA